MRPCCAIGAALATVRSGSADTSDMMGAYPSSGPSGHRRTRRIRRKGRSITAYLTPLFLRLFREVEAVLARRRRGVELRGRSPQADIELGGAFEVAVPAPERLENLSTVIELLPRLVEIPASVLVRSVLESSP